MLLRKRRLVLCFILLAVIFLVLQIFLHLQHSNVHSNSLKEPDGAFEAIKQFVDVCHAKGFPVFIVEPRILRSLINQSLTSCGPDCPSRCSYLCTSDGRETVTTFGIFSYLWNQSESALDAFRQLQFTITTVHNDLQIEEFIQADGSVSRDSKTLAVFSDFQHSNGHVIRIVIFHPLGSERYLWHGRLISETSQSAAVVSNELKLGPGAGLFRSIDLVKVVLDGIKLRAPRSPALFLTQIANSRFLECNYRQAEVFYAEYGQRDTSIAAQRFYTAARDTLMTAKRVLDSLGVRFWLSSGTCLGWFRQCDLIPYSKDVDIGIWIRDYREEIIPAMQNSGLTLIHRFGKVEDSFELSFLGTDVKLDIFFFYEEPDHMWNGGTQVRTGKKFKYIFPRFTLCWTQFLGLIVRVPCETQSYVEANYGQDWFYPVKSWDWKKSPPNVRENGEWPEDERNVVIQQFE